MDKRALVHLLGGKFGFFLRSSPISIGQAVPGERGVVIQLFARVLPFIVIVGLFASTSSAQESVLEHLPGQSRVYVWTESAHDLLLELQRSLDQTEREVEAKSDHLTVDASRASDADLLVELRRIVSLVLDPHVFSGQTILSLRISADDSTSHFRPTLIAQTDASEEEVEAILSPLCSLLDQSFANSEHRSELEEARDIEEFGVHWKLTEGWLCVSGDADEVDQVLGWVTGEKKLPAEQSLQEDRVFRTLMSKTSTSRQLSDLQISFYAPENTLPAILVPLFRHVLVTQFTSAKSWRRLHLHEWRGLGGRILIQDHAKQSSALKQLNATLAADMFLLTTQPAHGFLASLGNEDDPGIDYHAPCLDARLSSYLQFDIDPERFYEAIQEVQNPVEVQSQEPVSPEQARRSKAGRQMTSMWRRSFEATYHPTTSEQQEWLLPYSRFVFLETTDGKEYSELMDEFHSGNDLLQRVDNAALEVSDSAANRRIVAWGYPSEVIDGWIDDANKRMDEIREQLDDARETANSEANHAEVEQLEGQIKILESNRVELDRMRDSPVDRLVLDSWWLSNMKRQSLASILRFYPNQHPQVARLERCVEKIGEIFSDRRTPCGVIGLWPERLFALAMSDLDMDQFHAYGEARKEAERLASDSERRTVKVTEWLASHAPRLVAKIVRDADGLRVNVVVGNEEAVKLSD